MSSNITPYEIQSIKEGLYRQLKTRLKEDVRDAISPDATTKAQTATGRIKNIRGIHPYISSYTVTPAPNMPFAWADVSAIITRYNVEDLADLEKRLDAFDKLKGFLGELNEQD